MYAIPGHSAPHHPWCASGAHDRDVESICLLDNILMSRAMIEKKLRTTPRLAAVKFYFSLCFIRVDTFSHTKVRSAILSKFSSCLLGSFYNNLFSSS